MQNENTHDVIENTQPALEVAETDRELEVIELEDVPLTDVNFGF